MSRPDLILVYMTAGSPEEAARIARILVEERLAACVNMLPGMRSLYRWQGQVELAEEVVLIAKTRRVLFDSLAARVRQIHSYDTPCILEIGLGRGDAGYLDWLVAETAPAAPEG